MKRLFVLFVVLIIISGVFAKCEDGQIDINSASLEELDELYGIGESKAKEIINSRPFDCVDDLIDVNGIGETTLENIKKQGLVCVGDEDIEEKNSEEGVDNKLSEKESNYEEEKKEDAGIDVIKLNAKVIKSEENKESLDNANYIKYGFVVFCVLAGFFVILWKRRYKTEFN